MGENVWVDWRDNHVGWRVRTVVYVAHGATLLDLNNVLQVALLAGGRRR
jgi:hypothetical protein